MCQSQKYPLYGSFIGCCVHYDNLLFQHYHDLYSAHYYFSLSPSPSLPLQVLCWGVRDMKRFQLLPVTSPLVEVECGGTVVRSEHIKDAKKNPNFPKPVVSFEVVGTCIATCTCVYVYCI